jgi:hypothetical protein
MMWISTAGYIGPQKAVGALEILSKIPRVDADMHSLFQGNSIFTTFPNLPSQQGIGFNTIAK